MSTHQAVADARNADVLISINGELVPRADAKISVFDSGFLVGDGIWEGIRLHEGEFAFLDRHLDRLEQASRTTMIEIDRNKIEAALWETVERNDMHDDVHVRLMVTRGDKSTPSQHPSNIISAPNVVIIAEHKVADPTVIDAGLSLFTSTVRRPPPDSLDQRLNCHSKLHEVIALLQAVGAGADEALMLDPTGAVATCNATNFFIIVGDDLVTSTGHYNLPGITRGVLLEIADRVGLRAQQRPFSLTDVYGADEVFVTGTFAGLTPVREVDGRTIADGSVPGPRTASLRGAYHDAVAADVAASAAARSGSGAP